MGDKKHAAESTGESVNRNSPKYFRKREARQAQVVERLLPYIDAAAESSRRGRLILVFITIASVTAFSGYWKSLDSGWMNSRLRVLGDALQIARLEGEDAAIDYRASNDTESERAKKASEADAEANCQPLEQAAPEDAPEDESKLPGDRTRRALKLLREREGIAEVDIELLQTEYAALVATRLSHVYLVTVPFFGISFDINDLSLITGGTFTALLLWLYFSLLSEKSDVRVVFERAIEQGHPRAIYELLGMRQVLSIPPIIQPKDQRADDKPNPMEQHRAVRNVIRRQSTDSRRVLNGIARLQFLLPVSLQIAIWLNDYQTIAYGQAVAEHTKVDLVVIGGAALMVLVGILTAFCLKVSIEMGAEWERTAAYCEEHEP